MPLSNGFGRKIMQDSLGSDDGRSYELYDNPPPTPVEKKLVLVKTFDNDYRPPTPPRIVIERVPKKSPQKRIARSVPLKEEQEDFFIAKCCHNPLGVDEYQCFDCTNGKCCRACQWLVTMFACPTWFWFLLLLFNIGLITTLIIFIINSPTKTYVYKYINLLSTYLNYTYINRDTVYYLYNPCYDNNTDLTNASTTAIPLCNQTTTRVAVTVNQYVVNNVINSVTAANSRANWLHVPYISTLFYQILLVLIFNFFY